ncbi:hypothetical protein [Reyranella sp.]|uniref:hypothetical protein n=1 Tax=Reyranella sp. TaxID=1929291 RepID=UPI003BAAE9C8
MKRNLVLTAMAVAVAGAGSVAAFSMVSPGVASQQTVPAPQAAVAVPAPVAQPVVVVTPGPAPATVPAPTASVQKASLEVHQAPVPLLMKARPAVDLAAVQDATEAADEKTDGFDQKAAQAFIEADGYRGVQVLDKSPSGSWRAKALRGKTVVMLTVDASGSVSAD